MKLLWVILGSFFVCVGVLGVFLPVLPTTPFLLLAVACYAKGSQKCHHWILHNKLFGSYIRNYALHKGISKRAKISTLLFLWLSIVFSAYFSVLWLRIVLVIVALAVSVHILKLRTIKNS